MSQTEKPVVHPTWLKDIRAFFTAEDIDHMGQRGIDLATYDGVKANALRIMGATEPPDATMPPDAGRKWSQARWDTFKNWIVADYPFGTAVAHPTDSRRSLVSSSAARVRKDASRLTADEIEKVRTAFNGIQQLDPDDSNSYFAIAGIHWLPAHPQLFCLHHENRYNPWHRAYLNLFEDALRTVPGCEDVTLPYWDITSRIPAFLYEPPFSAYTLPRGIGGGFEAGYVTARDSADQVEANVAALGIPGQITDALGKSVWSQFNSRIIQAHDNGHGATGDTLRQQDVAAYDPIFWFFHANLDRLWWKWQQALNATTLNGFLSTVTGSTDWLRTAPFNSIPPFPDTADQTIDLTARGVEYEHPPAEPPQPFADVAFGSLAAAALRGLAPSRRVSVRVREIDRLNIPGSFMVVVSADDDVVARQVFFQARNPRACGACVRQGKVNIDLEADLDRLVDKRLRVEIRPLWPNAMGATFPLSSAGDPTVNVRLLLR